MKIKPEDLSKMRAAQRRVEKVIAPRDGRLGLVFVRDDVEAWKRAAEREGCESLTRWIEFHLDMAVGSKKVPRPRREAVAQAILGRDCPLNRRFSSDKIAEWKRQAGKCELSQTEWIERWLNHAARKVRDVR